MAMSRALLRVATMNFDDERGGDPALLGWLLKLIGFGVLFSQERGGKGLESTRVRGVRLTVTHRVRLVLGRTGRHRAVVVARTIWKGQVITLVSAHGLHQRTVGKARAVAWMVLLGARVRRLRAGGRHVVVGMDANMGVRKVEKILGLKGVGTGSDMILTTPGLEIVDWWADDAPEREGWSNHPALFADLRLRGSGE